MIKDGLWFEDEEHYQYYLSRFEELEKRNDKNFAADIFGPLIKRVMEMLNMKKKLIAIDFDGVLYSFKSGWTNARKIADPPTAGAITWLKCLLASQHLFDVCIFSARNRRWGGKKAIRRWLRLHGLTEKEVLKIKFPIFKPASDLLIDDRVFCFTGTFPLVSVLFNFEPWHGQSIWGDNE